MTVPSWLSKAGRPRLAAQSWKPTADSPKLTVQSWQPKAGCLKLAVPKLTGLVWDKEAPLSAPAVSRLLSDLEVTRLMYGLAVNRLLSGPAGSRLLSRSQRTIVLRFLSIVLGVLRLEVSVWIS